jgi:hypothetical protein
VEEVVYRNMTLNKNAAGAGELVEHKGFKDNIAGE